MFREEEMKYLDSKHNNVLVISLKITNILVKISLIDIRSSTNTLYYDAF